ncbi:T9SS type A sorting domain-containing protein [Rubrivirga sp. IMCC43871]|uniref:T9SS type A sorting domain-containing protein n=1 Tax=Rubrivirga sp. IMCC43871 TaxID=3391575 RepID=UPI00398FB435
MSRSATRPFHSALVVLAAVLLIAPASHASAREVGASNVRLSRTFTPPAPRSTTAVRADAFEMTRDDFLSVYAYGLEVEIGRSPAGETYPMNVGFTDDAGDGPTAWTAPDIAFETVTWRIVDPASTPYGAQFPTATHMLVTSEDPAFDGTRHRFYDFQAGQLELVAKLDIPADGADPIGAAFDMTVTLLPLNAQTEFYESGVHFYDDEEEISPEEPFHAEILVGFHGYGTLTLADGTAIQAGSFYNDFDIYRLEGDDDTFDFESLYSFNGHDGTWYSFRIANPPGWNPDIPVDVQGDVWIDEVEYWKMAQSSVAVGEGPDEAARWSVFPNPATDVVRFSQPLTATVFDVMGRAVREAHRATEVDLRGLASGTYVVRSEAGHSRTVTVRR